MRAFAALLLLSSAAASPAQVDRHGDPLPPGVRLRIGTVRLRHDGAVRGVAFSPDGTRLYSTSWTSSAAESVGTVKVWDAATGRLLREFGRGALELRLSPDGTTLAYHANAEQVELWDAASGRRVRVLESGAHPEWSRMNDGFAFAPDGASLAMANFSGLYLIDVKTGRRRLVLPTEDWGLSYNRPAFTADGRSVLAVRSEWVSPDEPAEPTIRVISVETGREAPRLPVSPTGHYVLSPDARVLATVSASGRDIVIRDVAAGRVVRVIHTGAKSVDPAAFSADGSRLAAAEWRGGRLRAVRVWDVAGGRAVGEFASAGTPQCFSPDGRTLAVACGPDIQLWDYAAGRRRLDFAGTDQGVSEPAFVRGGAAIAGGDGRTVRVFDAKDGRPLAAWPAHAAPIMDFSASADGHVVTNPVAGPIRAWDAYGKLVAEIPRSDSARYNSGQWAGGRLLRVSIRKAEAVVEEPPGGAAARRYATPAAENPVAVIATPDGGRIVFIATPGDIVEALRDSTERTFGVWDAATARLLWSERQPGPTFAPYCLSADGDVLALVRGDAVELRRTATGERLRRIDVPGSRSVNRLTLSADGRRLAVVAYANARVTVFDVASGGAVRTLAAAVYSASFAPDGRSLATGGPDGNVLVWDLPG